MILNSTKFGGNRTKDLEVGADRQTDRSIPIYDNVYDNVSTDVQFLEHENYKFDIFQLIIRPNSETIKGIIT